MDKMYNLTSKRHLYNSYRLSEIDSYIAKRHEEFENSRSEHKNISSIHYYMLIHDIIRILSKEPTADFMTSYFDSNDERILDALDFIDRYLALDLDEFNATSLLKKLREILTRGDDYPKEE